MGDRYLLCRIAPVEGQFERALDHAGEATERMRRELSEAVVRLFAARRPEPRPLSLEERGRISRICSLVVRLRAAVDRHRYTTEIEVIHGAEGTGRLGLSLERLLAGLDTLGVDRDVALNVVETVAMDSTPPIRRRTYEYLRHIAPRAAEIADIAENVRIPEKTLSRHLEDLEAQGLVRHIPAEKRGELGYEEGNADCGRHSFKHAWSRAVNDMDGPRRGPTTVSAICINTCTPDRLSNLHKHVYGQVAVKTSWCKLLRRCGRIATRPAIPSGEHQMTSGHFHHIDTTHYARSHFGSGSAVRAAEITRGEVCVPVERALCAGLLPMDILVRNG